MSAIKCHMWLILAAVVISIPDRATAATQLIDDFSSPVWLDNWSFVPGEEFPGAKGVLIADEGFRGSGASLRFDFSCVNVTGACNPHYVAASRQFDTPIPGEVLSLWVRCNACEPLFRITDATGQRLTYGPVALPLAATSLDAWHRVVLSLRADIAKYQDGASDGIFHPGIREIRVIAQEDDILTPTGALRFDQVRLHDSLDEAFSQEVSLAFPPDSFRAPPDGIARVADILGGVKSDNVPRVAAAGFSYNRMNLSWGGVEKKLGEYDFHKYDRIVQEAQNSGIGTLFMLGLGHPVYTGGEQAPPRSDQQLDAYAKYVQASAKYFKGKRVAFEIWNEPNYHGYWEPTPSAKEYSELLRRGIAAIRGVDPDATIITAGLSGWGDSKWQYLGELLQSKAVAGADFLGIHTYTEEKIGEPEGRWQHLLRGRQVVEELMAKPLPFWVSEWGFSSTLLDPGDNGHRPESRHAQAVMVVRELLVWKLAGMPENVYHNLIDSCGDAANNKCNFGLLTDTLQKKPAMIAVETLEAQLRSRELTGILKQKYTLPPWLNVARFQGMGGVVLVAWISSPKMQIKLKTPGGATARDLYGHWVAAGNEVFTLKYSDGPVYVTVPAGT
jgi:Cellulase (glycosyl hydrolase family 5)